MRTPEELQKIFEGPTGRRLCLLFVGLLSFSMSTLWAPPSSYTQIPLQGDHAKFFWFTLKQTQWFLDHGSPFGVAAYIHNAMPGFFFLRTGFVFYLPFYLFFGPALGYALLTVSATVLFAIGTFLLVEALQFSRWVAFTFALMTALGLGLTDYLAVGMVPYVLALCLNVWLLACLTRAIGGETRWLYPAAALAAACVYTHVASLVGVMAPAGIIFALVLIKQKRLAEIALPACLAFTCFALLALPWFVNFFLLSDYINGDYLFASENSGTLFHAVWVHAIQLTGHRPALPTDLPTAFALWRSFALGGATVPLVLVPVGLLLLAAGLNRALPDAPPARTLVWLGVFAWCSVAFGFVPGLRIVFQRVVSWLPLLSAFLYLNAFYLLLERFSSSLRLWLLPFASVAFWVASVLVAPPLVTPLESTDDVAHIDEQLNQWVDKNDGLLLENCAHVNPTKDQGLFEACGDQHHWTGLLSDRFKIPIFAHAGDDPHPFMVYRNNYLNSGTFNGDILSEHNLEAFKTQLNENRITKACVFSERARIYFFTDPQWRPLGASPLYHCYARTEGVEPGWRLQAVSPFELELNFNGPKAHAQLPVNFYPLWKAKAINGTALATERCGDWLCLKGGSFPKRVRLLWPKQTVFSGLALLGLILAFLFFRRHGMK